MVRLAVLRLALTTAAPPPEDRPAYPPIGKGDAEVRVSVEGNLIERIATLSAGDFFGEMGMMTGEPRAATVIALSEAKPQMSIYLHDLLILVKSFSESFFHFVAIFVSFRNGNRSASR